MFLVACGKCSQTTTSTPESFWDGGANQHQWGLASCWGNFTLLVDTNWGHEMTKGLDYGIDTDLFNLPSCWCLRFKCGSVRHGVDRLILNKWLVFSEIGSTGTDLQLNVVSLWASVLDVGYGFNGKTKHAFCGVLPCALWLRYGCERYRLGVRLAALE